MWTRGDEEKGVDMHFQEWKSKGVLISTGDYKSGYEGRELRKEVRERGAPALCHPIYPASQHVTVTTKCRLKDCTHQTHFKNNCHRTARWLNRQGHLFPRLITWV